MSATEREERRTVLLQDPELWIPAFRDPLESTFAYRVFRANGPLEGTLAQCLNLAPCVLLLEASASVGLEKELPAGYLSGNVATIVVAADTDPDATAEFLYRGCRGVLTADASAETVRRAVDAVSRGEIWAPRSVVSSLLQKCLIQVGPNALTHREQDILRLIGLGLTNREIGEELHIARETVRWHIRSVYSKIGASDRLVAAMYAKETLLWPAETLSRAGAGHAGF